MVIGPISIATILLGLLVFGLRAYFQLPACPRCESRLHYYKTYRRTVCTSCGYRKR